MRKIVVLGLVAISLASCTNPFETAEGRKATIAKWYFDHCVTELPKYSKNTLPSEINEACADTASKEAEKQYKVEQLTGKKLYVE